MNPIQDAIGYMMYGRLVLRFYCCVRCERLVGGVVSQSRDVTVVWRVTVRHEACSLRVRSFNICLPLVLKKNLSKLGHFVPLGKPDFTEKIYWNMTHWSLLECYCRKRCSWLENCPAQNENMIGGPNKPSPCCRLFPFVRLVVPISRQCRCALFLVCVLSCVEFWAPRRLALDDFLLFRLLYHTATPFKILATALLQIKTASVTLLLRS